MNKQTTELEEGMLRLLRAERHLEDAFWRLRDLQRDPANFPDGGEASDKVGNIVTELGKYFA
jgi:hypothetical protein